VHLELHSWSAPNRQTGINEISATWITFQDEGPGCQAGVDYNWEYHQGTDSTGHCIDIYTFDNSLDFLENFCNLSVSYDNSTGATLVYGIINIRTITIREITRPSGIDIPIYSLEYSQQGFEILITNTVTVADTTVRVYNPVDVTALIYDYDIPLGDTDKYIYIETQIQNPGDQGFMLVFPSGWVPTEVPGIPGTYPPVESNLVTPLFGPLNSSDPYCSNVVFLSPTEGNITLCVQRWQLTLEVAPGVCQINNSLFNIPFEIQCVPGVSQLNCPLTNTTDQAVIQVSVNTDYFCPVLIGQYQFTGSLSTYWGDFSSLHSGFFQNQPVGLELDITDASSNALDNAITGITITYLAGVLSQNPVSPSNLFIPNIYSLATDPAVQVAILVGPNISDNAAEAFLSPDVCSTYPMPGNFTGGCAPNSLRFEFTLASTLWQVPADEYSNLYIAVEVQLSFGGTKKIVSSTLSLQPPSSSVAQTNVVVGGIELKSCAYDAAPVFMLVVLLSLISLIC